MQFDIRRSAPTPHRLAEGDPQAYLDRVLACAWRRVAAVLGCGDYRVVTHEADLWAWPRWEAHCRLRKERGEFEHV